MQKRTTDSPSAHGIAVHEDIEQFECAPLPRRIQCEMVADACIRTRQRHAAQRDALRIVCHQIAAIAPISIPFAVHALPDGRDLGLDHAAIVQIADMLAQRKDRTEQIVTYLRAEAKAVPPQPPEKSKA